MPPLLLIRFAVALVWFYEGFWCKVLGRLPHQEKFIGSVPLIMGFPARTLLLMLGYLECALALWIMSGWQPWWAALFQTVLLAGMNTMGLSFARSQIHDPGGMLVKNFALIVLAWVAAAPIFR